MADIKLIQSSDKGWVNTLNNDLKNSAATMTRYQNNVVLENGWANANSNMALHIDIWKFGDLTLSHVLGELQTPSGWNGSQTEAIRIGGAPYAAWPYVGINSINSSGTFMAVVSFSISGGGSDDLTVSVEAQPVENRQPSGWLTVNFWY